MHDDYLPTGNTASRYAPLRLCGAAGNAAVVLAMLAACPGSPSSSKAAPSPAAASPPVVVAARSSIDAGTTAIPVPVEDAPAEFRVALEAIHAWLSLPSWKDWHILVNNAERKERLAWLAKDFGSRVFRQADRVDEAYVHAQTSAGLLHVGLLVAEFPTCKQLAAAYGAVVKSGRSNFALPILTMFRSKTRGHSLLFVFSETTLQPQVGPLLDRYDSLLGTDMRCSD
jgi:hypothetical protein